MIQIRPVSDLRNKFTDIENTVKTGVPVYLTKNGYGSMVVLSIDAYSKLVEEVENALDVADKLAKETDDRYTHEEMFSKLKGDIVGKKIWTSLSYVVLWGRLPDCESFEPYHSIKKRDYPYYRIYVKNYIVYYVVIPVGDKKIMEVRRFLYKGQDRDNIV